MGDPTRDSLVGTWVAGRFKIQEKLAAGGMGVVYRAHQKVVDREVAIKVLRPERANDEAATEQFLREARAVSQLSSPHTVTVIDVGPLDSGGWFLAMELLDGVTLHQRLRDGPIDLHEAVRIADQIALSLGEAHARGIVHRDLKPLNVLLARTPGHTERVKVLDFGLAKLTNTDGLDAAAGGTPRYMAPETICGDESSPRADVYALGLIFYEMIAGKHPFEALEGDELLKAQLESTPPAVSEAAASDVPAGVRRLLERSLAKHPQLRPRDGTEFRNALREAMGLPRDTPSQRAPSETSAPQNRDETKATLPSTVSLTRLRERLAPDRQTTLKWLVPAAALVLGVGLYVRSQPSDPQLPPPPSARASSVPQETQAPASAEPPNAEPAPAPPARETVAVLIHSIPDGATVTVDGKRRGVTPISITLEKDVKARVRLQLAGHGSHQFELLPVRDEVVRRVFKRRAPPATSVDPVEQKVDHYLD